MKKNNLLHCIDSERLPPYARRCEDRPRRDKALRPPGNGQGLEKGEVLRAVGLFTQLGLSMAACVFVGVGAGKLLDTWLGTTPWLLALCAAVGGIASIKTMYDIVISRWK